MTCGRTGERESGVSERKEGGGGGGGVGVGEERESGGGGGGGVGVRDLDELREGDDLSP